MKINAIKFLTLSILTATTFVSCNNDDTVVAEEQTDFSGTYVQKDQMARPAINTVFIASGAPKDAFNTTTPSAMGANYQATFQSRLLALNSGYSRFLLLVGYRMDSFKIYCRTKLEFDRKCRNFSRDSIFRNF